VLLVYWPAVVSNGGSCYGVRMIPGRKQAALLVLATSLVTHSAYLGARGPAVQADGIEYRRLADNLRQFWTFGLDQEPPVAPSVRRAPGFPALIALVGSVPATIALQVMMAACVALFVFLFASTMVPVGAAFVLALLYAVHPANVYWTRMLHSEASFTFFSMASLWLLLEGLRRSSVCWLLFGGGLLGVAALCRPVGAPFIVVAATVVFALSPRGARLRQSMIVMIVGLAVIAPWVVRSSLLADRFILISATAPANLYVGAQSGQPIYNDVWFQHFLRNDPCGLGFNTARTPIESGQADELCGRGALAAIKGHPVAYLVGRGPALAHLLSSSFDVTLGNTASVGELRARRAWGLLAVKVILFLGFCIAPFLVALFGIGPASKTSAGALTLALWIYTMGVYAPGYTEFRYFFPAVAALYVTTSVGLWRLMERRRT
jgi:hypothetical protein